MTAEIVTLPNADGVDLDDAAKVLAPKKAVFRRASGLCRWCKAPKSARRENANFCSDQCRSDHHNHFKKQGAQAVTMLKRWRRYGRKGDFSLLTRIVDDLIREDKALGVEHYPDPPAHYSAKVVATNITGRRRAS